MIKGFKWLIRRIFSVFLFTPMIPIMLIIKWIMEDNSTVKEAANKVWVEYKEFAWGIKS